MVWQAFWRHIFIAFVFHFICPGMAKTHLHALIVYELVVDVIWESLDDEEGVLKEEMSKERIYIC